MILFINIVIIFFAVRLIYSFLSELWSEPFIYSDSQGGLKNIGNSCYLNSVLQCILHCEPIKKYLLNKEFSGQVNSRSKTRGRVVESSADLFKSLISGQTASPSSVKAAVSSASGLFRGTAQEDAQEFLRWYLEG
jgi:ubiquitin C-terminal hydrolase